MSQLTELPIEWDYTGAENLFKPEAISFLKFLCKKVYQEFEPNDFKPFENRLVDWLNNLDDEEQQKAFIAMLLDVFFIGRTEFESLYRLLLNSSIARWIIDVESLEIADEELSAKLIRQVNSSWICPVTDSLRINAFLKVNNLETYDIRPDWRSLKRLGCNKKISGFIEKHDIKRLILIEDFIGSGTQVKSIVKFAATEFPNLDILIAPLVVCPDGHGQLKKLDADFINLTYHPALELPIISKFPNKADANTFLHTQLHSIFDEIENRLKLIHKETVTGYRSTGAQVVMYSNCPNNSLPVYHKHTENWIPLFQRVARQ